MSDCAGTIPLRSIRLVTLRMVAMPILAASLVSSGCGAGSDAGSDSLVVDTIGGVEHVTSAGPGAWERGGGWRVEAAGLTLGAADGPEELTFGRVAGVVVDAAGRVLVADAQANEVRVFGADGSFEGRLGRAGEGPGEFRNISGLSRAPDGVAVLDGALARVTVFRPGGSVARTFRLERPYQIFRSGAVMRFDEAGRFYDEVPLSGRPGVDSIGVVVYDPEGEPMDTVLVAVVESDHLMVERDGRPIMSFTRPFAPQASLAVGPDGGIHYARGGDYRIVVLSPGGDTVRVIRRDVAAVPVTAEERDAALADIEARYREASGGAAPRGIRLPDTKPAIQALRVDDAGHVWVLSPDGSGGPGGTMRWSVHAPDGGYLGAVDIPAMAVLDIGTDHIAGVTWDELGVQRVVVRRLERR